MVATVYGTIKDDETETMKVLVTDDDPDSRELVRLTLAMHGIQVIEASGGAECLKIAEEAKPDAIILDVMMPFMDGPTTLTALRANPATASIPVILLTASVMPSEVRRLESLGARAVVSKPFEPFSLPARVQEILGTANRPVPRGPRPAAATDEMGELRAQFVRRSQAKIENAARLLSLMRGPNADPQHLQDLMRFFHSLAGVGTSFGFPQITALAKEGELECLALLHDKAVPSPTEIENWTSLLGALAHELSQHPAAAGGTPAPSTAVAATSAAPKLAEVLLVSSDADVAGTLAPLLSQEGASPRTLATRAAAAEALGRSLPDALIVDAVLDDGSGYDVIDRLRGLSGGEAVPVLVLGPRGGFLDKVEAIHGGADGFFEKPVDWKALMRRLQHLLEANETHTARILSVEDDPEQAAYLKAILESGGYEVAVCEDPKKFETALRSFQPDLVLMDILLPHISGYDLVRYLRQDERHATLPVLFLTTESQLQSRFRSAQVGGDDHLTKPVVPPVLLSVVASRLERARFLKNLLNRDGLTRLYTHTALIERAQALHAQKARDPARQCAWVMIDLDHFKSVNDRFGHPVGDRVLASLSALLRRRLRQSDTIGRYGGEEFAVLFEGLPEHEVVRLTERVLQEFREIDLEAPGKPNFRATFSAGVAMLQEGATLDAWKKAADDALYAAKAAGRNRVVAAAPAPQEGARAASAATDRSAKGKRRREA
jgi:diguanylate cyclase (GGDEF)-like protein